MIIISDWEQPQPTYFDKNLETSTTKNRFIKFFNLQKIQVFEVKKFMYSSLHKNEVLHEGFLQYIRPNPQFPSNLVTFTEEILNGKPHFLCNGSCYCNVMKLFGNTDHIMALCYWVISSYILVLLSYVSALFKFKKKTFL